MVRNSLLAVAVGLEMGISLPEAAQGLARASLTAGRLQQKVVRGIYFMDDTYNANPDSMVAALDTIRQIPGAGRRIAVLGQMGESARTRKQGTGKWDMPLRGMSMRLSLLERMSGRWRKPPGKADSQKLMKQER